MGKKTKNRCRNFVVEEVAGRGGWGTGIPMSAFVQAYEEWFRKKRRKEPPEDEDLESDLKEELANAVPGFLCCEDVCYGIGFLA